MATRKQLWHPDEVKKRIKTSQLINRLNNHALSEIEGDRYTTGDKAGHPAMKPDQVQAAFGLIRKTVADLKSIELQGNVGLIVTLPEGTKDI